MLNHHHILGAIWQLITCCLVTWSPQLSRPPCGLHALLSPQLDSQPHAGPEGGLPSDGPQWPAQRLIPTETVTRIFLFLSFPGLFFLIEVQLI